ncbi:hypothetical protein V5O48_018862, partial [Marasmius crinis-equi]
RWRLLALSLPELWTKIDVKVYRISGTVRRGRVAEEMLRTILERAAGQKLHISVSTHLLTPNETKRFFAHLQSTLRDWASLTLSGIVSSKWGTYTVYGVYSGLSLFPTSADRAGFSSLEEFTIQHMGTFEYRGKLVDALTKAPKLRSLVIDQHPAQCPVLHATPPPPFNWSNLVHLDPGFMSHFSGYHQQLAMCTRLQTLVINTLHEHHIGDDTPMVELQSLELKTQAGLETDFESVIALVERSAPVKLTYIPVENVCLTDDTVGRLLQRTPHVTRFTVNGHILPFLPSAIVSGELLPNVEHVSVGISTLHYESLTRYALAGPTLDSIESLAKSGTPKGTLKSLRIVDEDVTTNMLFFPGRPARVESYQSREAEQKSQDASSPDRVRTTAAVFDHLLSGGMNAWTDRACSLLHENMELLEYIVTAMEDDETGGFEHAFRCKGLEELTKPSVSGDRVDGMTQIKDRLLVLKEKWAGQAV